MPSILEETPEVRLPDPTQDRHGKGSGWTSGCVEEVEVAEEEECRWETLPYLSSLREDLRYSTINVLYRLGPRALEESLSQYK